MSAELLVAVLRSRRCSLRLDYSEALSRPRTSAPRKERVGPTPQYLPWYFGAMFDVRQGGPVTKSYGSSRWTRRRAAHHGAKPVAELWIRVAQGATRPFSMGFGAKDGHEKLIVVIVLRSNVMEIMTGCRRAGTLRQAFRARQARPIATSCLHSRWMRD